MHYFNDIEIHKDEYPILHEIQSNQQQQDDIDEFMTAVFMRLADSGYTTILLNCITLIQNCADPDQDCLDFNPEIKAGLELLEKQNHSLKLINHPPNGG